MRTSEILDLKHAYSRALRDARDDSVPDILRHYDFGQQRDELLASLADDLHEGRWRPKKAMTMDIPKADFTVRPCVCPAIQDRIVYQAVADCLLPHFKSEECVYSHKPNPVSSRTIFKQGVGQWERFQEEVERLAHEYEFMLETDLVAYFEHVLHERLLRRMDDVFAALDQSVLNLCKDLLGELLRSWANNRKWGIPQVFDPSSLLGELYLDEVDKIMLRQGLEYRRYVDDFRVFAHSDLEARGALRQLIRELRRIGLYVSAKKTHIYRREDVLEQLDAGRKEMKDIEAAFESRNQEVIEASVPTLVSFFEKTLKRLDGNEPFSDRHFRFCIYRFILLTVLDPSTAGVHDKVMREVLSRLRDMPHATSLFVDYLSCFPECERAQDAVIDFLNSEANIYEWQEMWLLELLIRMDLTERNKKRVKKSAWRVLKEGKHPLCSAKAFILLGKTGNYADRAEIKEQYFYEDSLVTKRGILMGLQELPPDQREYFYRNCRGHADEIDRTIDYLLALHTPMYHFFSPPLRERVVEILVPTEAIPVAVGAPEPVPLEEAVEVEEATPEEEEVPWEVAEFEEWYY